MTERIQNWGKIQESQEHISESMNQRFKKITCELIELRNKLEILDDNLKHL